MEAISAPLLDAHSQKWPTEDLMSSSTNVAFESGEFSTAATSITLVDAPGNEAGNEEIEERHEQQEPSPQIEITAAKVQPSELEKKPEVPHPDGDIDAISDVGGPSSKVSEVILNSLYNPYDPPTFYTSLDERIKKAPKQVSQIFQYTRLMEERMQLMEYEIHKLKEAKKVNDEQMSGVDGLTKPEQPGDGQGVKDIPPTLIPGIKKQSWADFRFKEEATHSIEILLGDPGDSVNLDAEKVLRKIADVGTKTGTQAKAIATHGMAGISLPVAGNVGIPNEIASTSTATNLDSKMTSASAGTVKPERPGRIRIQSRFLRKELKAITNYNIMHHSRELLGPYRPLVMFESEIRAHHTVLEERLISLQEEEAQAIREEEQQQREAKKEQQFTQRQKVAEIASTVDETIPVMAEKKIERGDEDGFSGSPEPASSSEMAKEASSAPLWLTPVQPAVFPRKVSEVIKAPGIETAYPERNAIYHGAIMMRNGVSLSVASNWLANSDESEIGADEKFWGIDEKHEDKKRVIIMERRLTIWATMVVIEEWKALLQLFDEHLIDIITVRNAIKNGGVEQILFDDLCYLFEPGQLVCSSDNKRQLLEVFSTSGGRKLLIDPTKVDDDEEQQGQGSALGFFSHSAAKYSPFVIDCYHYDFDGSHIGSVQKTFRILRFKGLEKVKSLFVYPSDIHSCGEFVTRGRNFLTLCSGKTSIVHRRYYGLSADDPAEEVDSPVIIDADLAARILPEDQPKGGAWVPKLTGIREPSAGNPKETTEAFLAELNFVNCPILDDEVERMEGVKEFVKKSQLLQELYIKEKDLEEDKDLAILPYRVFGFVLRSRKWGKLLSLLMGSMKLTSIARLDIECIKEIPREESNFEKLVLPKGHKEIVQALVETHFPKDKEKDSKKEVRNNIDLVRGKGKGLIILLHGAPGVGKTSTAETVAEYTGRPLFAITCGDIGETAKDVETNLDRCFQMAHRWGCVLLLDEADVFLAKRGKADLKRNALVSVFLRVLEYYAGILFLTTNRVGTFDEAFKSRIHM